MPARAASILGGLGFTSEMQTRATKGLFVLKYIQLFINF